MADRMAAEIWIGGKLSRSLLDEFPISDLTVGLGRNSYSTPHRKMAF